MNRLLLIFALGIFIVSCSSNTENGSDTDKLASYKEQVEELNQKISDIEKSGISAEYTGIEIPVKTEKIVLQPFSHHFVATGELESIEDAYISPEVAGQITSVKVNEGQQVKKGQVLAKLNTIIVEKNITEIESQLGLAKIIFDKQASLWERNIGSEVQYLEAKNNYESLGNKLNTLKAQYSMSIIKSPIDGIVEEVFLKKGELASPGMQFMQVVNINKLYVTVKLSEAYLLSIKKGDIVDITFPSYPGIVYSEPVYRIGNVINKQNRTFIVQMKIDNKNGTLKPHLLANININDYNTNEAIILQSIIIKSDMNGPFIYVLRKDNGNNVAAKKYIKTGISYKDKTEVLEGLGVGDVIITDGYNNVSNGSVVTVIE